MKDEVHLDSSIPSKSLIIKEAFHRRFPEQLIKFRIDDHDNSTHVWVNLGTNLACRLIFEEIDDEPWSAIEADFKLWYFTTLEVRDDFEYILEMEMPEEIRSFFIFNLELLRSLNQKSLTLQDVLNMLEK